MKKLYVAMTALLLTGCSYTRPGMIAPMSLGPKEKVIAVTKGEAGAEYFLGFNVGGADTYAAAIENAQLQAGVKNATMANVFSDEQIFCFPSCWFALYRSVKTTVFGTLITYDAAPDRLAPHTDNNGVL